MEIPAKLFPSDWLNRRLPEVSQEPGAISLGGWERGFGSYGIGEGMKSAILMAGLLFFVGPSLPHAQAQPSIAAATVVNAASRIPKGLPNYGIAQGSLFTLTGQGLVTAATPPITVADSPLPLTLAGASMQITVGGTKVDVPMVSAWAGFAQTPGARVDQLAGVAPSNTFVGDGTITVTVNGRTSAP